MEEKNKEEKKGKMVYIKPGIYEKGKLKKEIEKQLEEKPREKLPINYMANEFMNQQLTTLNKKINLGENKNDDTNGNGRTTS